MRSSRAGNRFVSLTALWVLSSVLGVRCGGGGGGGGGDGGGGGPTGLARIEGTIVLPDVGLGMVSECEPNGSVGQAQPVPPLQPDSSLVVAGTGGTTAVGFGEIDTTDAFRLVSHEPQEVTLVLWARTGGVEQGDFDLAVFDTATGDPIEANASASNPKVSVFDLDGDAPVDVVVTCASGWGAYTLSIETTGLVGAAAVAPAAVARAVESMSVEALDYALVEPACAPARVLLRPEAGRDPTPLAAAAGARVARTTSGGSLVLEFAPRLRTAGARESVARAARLAASAGVRWAEPDWRVESQGVLPDDPGLAGQWHLFGIGAPSAWETTFGSSSVVVATVDTGIAAHPDLVGQTVGGYDFITDSDTAADGGGRDPDPTDPGARDNFDKTSQWHGTHVAGLVAARRDGAGVVGLAPDCRVMPLRVIGRGGGTASDLADAIRYAAGLAATEHGPALPSPVRIVNLSLGTSLESEELREACEAAAAAGSLLVAAAGNTGAPLLFPAAYPEVLAVGATDSRLLRADYSNTGLELDLLAPGGDDRDRDASGFREGVLSCSIDETRTPARPGTAHLVGSSMATAQVSAAAALLLSVDPSLTADELRVLLLSTAKDRGVAGHDAHAGHGVLHAGDAVKAALAGLGTPRPSPAVLVLSTRSVRFRPSEATAVVYAYNAGGGTLALDQPLASTDDGVPWLSAALTASPTFGPPDVPQIHLIVDPAERAALPPGSYAGTVRVTQASVVVGSIRVVMEVGIDPPTDETIQVVAQEEGSGIVRASGFADPWLGYRYVLKDLPPGRYVIKAGTDFDDDFFFCEGPDLCGRHGGFSTPTVVEVEEGDVRTGVDVALE